MSDSTPCQQKLFANQLAFRHREFHFELELSVGHPFTKKQTHQPCRNQKPKTELENITFCDSGTSLCPGNGLVGVNKPQKKGSPKANQSPVPKIRVSHTPENNNQRKTNQTRKGLTRNLGRQQAARLVPTNLAAARGLFLPRDAVGRRRGSATPIRGATEPKT